MDVEYLPELYGHSIWLQRRCGWPLGEMTRVVRWAVFACDATRVPFIMQLANLIPAWLAFERGADGVGLKRALRIQEAVVKADAMPLDTSAKLW